MSNPGDFKRDRNYRAIKQAMGVGDEKAALCYAAVDPKEANTQVRDQNWAEAMETYETVEAFFRQHYNDEPMSAGTFAALALAPRALLAMGTLLHLRFILLDPCDEKKRGWAYASFSKTLRSLMTQMPDVPKKEMTEEMNGYFNGEERNKMTESVRNRADLMLICVVNAFANYKETWKVAELIKNDPRRVLLPPEDRGQIRLLNNIRQARTLNSEACLHDALLCATNTDENDLRIRHGTASFRLFHRSSEKGWDEACINMARCVERAVIDPSLKKCLPVDYHDKPSSAYYANALRFLDEVVREGTVAAAREWARAERVLVLRRSQGLGQKDLRPLFNCAFQDFGRFDLS